MSDSTHTKPQVSPADASVLARINAVRLIIVGFIGLGYASTMAVGPQSKEWLNTFGYDPSLFGLQVLFFLSGWLAWRSLSQGRSPAAFILSRAKRVLPWLALYTLIIVALVYPLLCDPDAPIVKNAAALSLYFLKTVTLVQPGQPMPGALDNALYACLLQGAIWSLRWGAIAYIGLLSAYMLGLRHRLWYLAFFVIAVCAHIAVNAWTDQSGSAHLIPIIPGLRLAFPFLLGIAAYGWKDRLPTDPRGWLLISAMTLGGAAVHYYGFRWSYTIEILAMTGWCGLAMALLHSQLRWLKNWPNLVLPLFLGVWPTAQVLLAIFPTITVPMLVVASLTTALALAAFFWSLKRLVHRRIQTP
jgi:peptidoglycan/LPS O-acetylase OafA/YrhL